MRGKFAPFRCVAVGLLIALAARPMRAASAEPARYQSAVFNQVEIKEGVAYRTTIDGDDQPVTLLLDIYSPAGDREAARPAIIWLHGGGMRAGVDRKQGYVVQLATEFAKRGYVSFAVDYRVTSGKTRPHNPLPAAIDDVRFAVDWIRSHAADFHVDPNRIALGGGSAGGFVGIGVAAKPTAAAQPATPLFAFIDLWGSPSEQMTPKPIDPSFPPTLIVHGTADESVPFAFSEKLAAKLHAAGVKCTLVPLPGAHHTPVDHLPEIVDQTAKFLFAALPK